MRLFGALLLAAAAMLAVAMFPSTAEAAAGPVVVSFTAVAPTPLPSKGTPVVLRARIRRASTCTFLSRLNPFDEEFTPMKTVRCSSGSATATVAAVANPYTTIVRRLYIVEARGLSGHTTQASVAVEQASLKDQPTLLRTTVSGAPPPAPSTTTTATTPTTTTTLTKATPGTTRARQSMNWSGYELPTSRPVTAVSGTFTVPTVDCARSPGTGVSVWVGIGGDATYKGGSDGALLQTGVEAECAEGRQISYTWWELYPDIPNTAVALQTVHAGDLISASVAQTVSGWETVVNDLTGGYEETVDSTVAGYAYGGGYTAEWIVEAYSNPQGPVPLAAYGSETFSNCQTNLASWSLADADPFTIVQGGTAISTPRAPAGNGFTVTYTG